ncbi:MAG: hypothetical protein HQ468_08725 [Actinomycetales bacterium]|jgi:hypothetical protein|nr:hypothetical protein [Actinomycetales bacterium]|tara:strand:- start:1108 stop:1260 length:153 start_codon:yes stop_codon:yes gene_type:complete
MDFSVAARVGEVLASEEGGGSVVSPYVIGGFGFLALVTLLILTLMINVDR